MDQASRNEGGHSGLAILLGVLSFVWAVDARAEPAPVGGSLRPPSWDMTLSELQAIGLGQRRADPIPVDPSLLPPALSSGRSSVVLPVTAAPAAVIFVNFDGADLSFVEFEAEDSRQDTTQIEELEGDFEPYGGSSRDQAAVMQAVERDWAEYNVLVTDERPDTGSYVMNMVGPTNPFNQTTLGVALLDCEDRLTPNNVTFAFHSADDGFGASVTATTIGQEVAHSFGLEHVAEPGDIMNPINAGGDARFLDECISIEPSVIEGDPNGVLCERQHIEQCGSGLEQNSHAELIELFGPSAPDLISPSVQIVAPNDGAKFTSLASFTIDVEADDDSSLAEVRLLQAGEVIQTDASEPYGWQVNRAPDGEYVFTVEAEDLAGNITVSNTVTVQVGTPGPTGGDSGDSATTGMGNDEGETGDDGFDAGGDEAQNEGKGAALPPGYGEGVAEFDVNEDGNGCAVHAVGPEGRAAAWLLPLCFGLRRRRRSHR